MRRSRLTSTKLPFRVGIIIALCFAPIIAVFAFAHGRMALAVPAILIGIATGIILVEHVISRPLRAVQNAVDRWRSGEPFETGSTTRLPSELRALSLSFRRATRTLGRREAQLRTAVEQQELAMQEIHHRVKNNLQIVASLLNLQASRIRVPAAKAEFQAARDRVRALATLHRHLYAHGGVHTINMRIFLLELCGQLFQALGEMEGERLVLKVEAPELDMSSDQAVPLSLIVTEAVTNAVKYAYPAGRRGTINVRLRAVDDQVVLEICDDGIGIQLINGFAKQLGATLDVEQGAGTRYVVRMKLRRDRLESPTLRPGLQ